MSDLNESISPLVILKDVALNHQEHQVLSGVNLQIDPGEFLYLIGKTGSGKSSLLRALYGDLNLASGSGEVCNTDLSNLNRRNVHKLRRKLGIVFQDFGLLTDRSVSDNLKFALKATGWRLKNEIKNRIDEVLETVGLPHKGYKFPHELSGGEQQRVAIARALAEHSTYNFGRRAHRQPRPRNHKRNSYTYARTHHFWLQRYYGYPRSCICGGISWQNLEM